MEEITVEKIKEKIKEKMKENLRKVIEQDLTIKTSDSLVSVKPESFTGPNYWESMKEKFIAFGLKHKLLIDKIPVVRTAARQFYQAVIYKSILRNQGSDISKINKTSKIIIRNIPLVGYLVWWIYMIRKTPSRISQLSSDIAELRIRDEALESRISQLFSDTTELRTRGEALESKIRQLFPKVESYKKSVIEVNDWPEFYSKEINKEDMIRNIEHHKYFVGLITEWVKKYSDNYVPRLLEIGVGTATMSIYLSKSYFEVIGLDSDPIIVAKAIETNKKLGGYAKFITMDAFNIQTFFKEKSFDIAFSQGTMEHFNNEKLKKILEAQLHVAKYVVFSVPSINWPTEDFGNERRMTVEGWKTLLQDFGFRIEHLSYYQEGDLHIAIVLSCSDKEKEG